MTAAWYRWRDRHIGSRTPLRGYLAARLVLAAVTAALPLLAWWRLRQPRPHPRRLRPRPGHSASVLYAA